MTDAFGRFQRDLVDAVNDLDDDSKARREAAEQLGQQVSNEAPRVTGFLAGSVVVDDAGVGVTAVYAGVVHDANPYAERAVDSVDWLDPFVDHIDDTLGRNLRTLYL